MSNDKRLGANPLDWVDPNSKLPSSDIPAPDKETAPLRTDAAVSYGGGLFLPPGNLTKEDIVSKGKIKIKKTMDTSEAIAHLQDLTQSLDSGLIRAEDGENKIVMGVGENMQFEMKLSKKKDKSKCSIEMEWIDDGSNAEGFKITG